MNVLTLTRRVTVEGLDHWGRPSWLTFSPYQKAGWWWELPDGDIVPIDLETTAVDERRVVLRANGYQFNVIEHIILPRYKGLLGGMLITCQHFAGSDQPIRDGCWPPADGSFAYYWDQLEPALQTTDQPVTWTQPNQEGGWKCNDTGSNRSVNFRPNGTADLKIWVTIDYPELGELTICVRLPEDEHVLSNKIMPTKSQGMLVGGLSWQESQQAVAVSAKLPRDDVMEWPGDDTDIVRYLFAWHRAGDILAMLALASPPDALLSGDYTSMLGGHFGDDVTVREALCWGG